MIIGRQVAVFATLLAGTVSVFAGAATLRPREAPCVSADQVVYGAVCRTGIRPEDGDWRARISPQVPPPDAQLLVSAVRNSDIINKLPRATSGPRVGIAAPMPFIDPSQVTSINLDPTADGRRVYIVMTGCSRGGVFRLAIVDGKAELISVSFWIA